jgi:acyl-CoA dehydrogenase
MPVFKAPVDDTLFILNDVLGYERYMNLPGFADASPDIVEAILQEGARLSEEVMLPLNQVGDQEGCTRHDDATVTTPTGVQGSLQAILRRWLAGTGAPTEYRRPGPALCAACGGWRVHVLRKPVVHDVSRPDPGRDCGDPRAWLG